MRRPDGNATAWLRIVAILSAQGFTPQAVLASDAEGNQYRVICNPEDDPEEVLEVYLNSVQSEVDDNPTVH